VVWSRARLDGRSSSHATQMHAAVWPGARAAIDRAQQDRPEQGRGSDNARQPGAGMFRIAACWRGRRDRGRVEAHVCGWRGRGRDPHGSSPTIRPAQITTRRPVATTPIVRDEEQRRGVVSGCRI
jgi:hypothetical protein